MYIIYFNKRLKNFITSNYSRQVINNHLIIVLKIIEVFVAATENFTSAGILYLNNTVHKYFLNLFIEKLETLKKGENLFIRLTLIEQDRRYLLFYKINKCYILVIFF